jgi:hypothetical protein
LPIGFRYRERGASHSVVLRITVVDEFSVAPRNSSAGDNHQEWDLWVKRERSVWNNGEQKPYALGEQMVAGIIHQGFQNRLQDGMVDYPAHDRGIGGSAGFVVLFDTDYQQKRADSNPEIWSLEIIVQYVK